VAFGSLVSVGVRQSAGDLYSAQDAAVALG